MITWLWLIGTPVVMAAAPLGLLTLQLHRDGGSWAGVIAYHRMRRRP